MITLLSMLLAVALLCASTAAGQASATAKVFAPTPAQIRTSGWADVERTFSHGGTHDTWHDRVWFDARGRLRRESELGRCRQVMVLDGTHVFATLCRKDRLSRAKWSASPAAWFGGSMHNNIIWRCRLDNGRLVGRGRRLGLNAEHWRSEQGHRKRAHHTDVWISADQRFPLILNYQSTWPDRSLSWRITKLDIDHPVPSYTFTPEVRPRAGLIPILRSRYRPASWVLAWEFVTLCCYAAIVVPLGARARKSWKGALQCVIGCLCLFGLLLTYPNPDVFFHLLSDTWVLLAMAAMTGALLVFLCRKAGPPEGLTFRGTRWTSAFWLLGALCVSAASAIAGRNYLGQTLGVSLGGLHWMPVTLLNVAIFAVPSAAVQEIVFRGYVFDALIRRFQKESPAIVLQALLFSLYHLPRAIVLYGASPRIATDLLWTLLMGIGFGAMRWKYRNLAVPWIVHAVYNMLYLYITSTWMYGFVRSF